MFARSKMFTLTGALTAAIIAVSGQAHAATLSATEIFQQYNAVTIGDLNTAQEVEGRLFVGGNLTGSTLQVDFAASAPSDFADLVVLGDSTLSNINLNFNSASDVVIGGTNSANINNAASTSQIVVGSLPADLVPTGFASTLTTLSNDLGGLAANASEAVTGQSNLLRLNAAPTDGVTVYNIDIADLNRGGIEVDANGADLVVINVTGEGAITSNFQGGGLTDFAKVAVFNFVDAENLEFKQFFGQVLAPNATVTNTSPIEGFLFANSAILNGEIHVQTFAGNLSAFETPEISAVPLPAGGLLLLSGLMGLGLARRRKAAA